MDKTNVALDYCKQLEIRCFGKKTPRLIFSVGYAITRPVELRDDDDTNTNTKDVS